VTESTIETGCIDGFKVHNFPNGSTICSRCGWDKAKIKRSSRISQEKQSTSRKISSEPSFSRQEAKDGITMLLLASQTIILSARPDLKEDALNPQERMMLADALADEAFESTAVRKFLTKLGKQKKHTKLAMVCMAIMIPRLARHGLIPQDGMQELNDELIAQAGSSSRPDGNPTEGSETPWDAVSVESGGSPFPDRGNGFRQNDVSSVPSETAPLRSGVENENGRSEIRDASGSEIPLSDEKFTTESYRAKTGSTTSRQKKG
jgi:hypothetical protein